jgi:hypothetical protein
VYFDNFQSIIRAHKLPPAMMAYADDYRNAEFIQEAILKKYIFVPPGILISTILVR